MKWTANRIQISEGLKRARRQFNKNKPKDHQITQEDLAEKMEVSLKTVMNWEQGQAIPSVETLMKLAELYHCDLDYLTGRIDQKTHDLQFIHDQTGLSEKAIKRLQELPYYTDILSLIIEDIGSEYLIYLISKRVKGYDPFHRPKTHKELTQDDFFIDLDGQKILTRKRNLLDSLIQSEVANMIPIITETYHRTKTE